MTTFFGWLLVLSATIFFCLPLGMTTCSVMEARSEPPRIGVVQDVDKVPYMLGTQIYLQIDGATYRLAADVPLPVAGDEVEYRVVDGQIIDIEEAG